LRLEAGKTEAERAFQFVQLRLPKAGEPVTRQTFSFWLDKRKFQQAESHYLLRTNLTPPTQNNSENLYAADLD
jgi:hypothetical protein